MVARISIWNPEEDRPRKSRTLTVYDGTVTEIVKSIEDNFDTERPKKEPKPKKAKKSKKAKAKPASEF